MKPGEFSDEVKLTVQGRSLWRCEVCDEGPIAEYHHRRPRGSGGSKAADTGWPSNCLGICRECHRMIEKHRNIAKLLGWLVRQRKAASTQRVMYRGEWKLLTDDGQVVPYAEAA